MSILCAWDTPPYAREHCRLQPHVDSTTGIYYNYYGSYSVVPIAINRVPWLSTTLCFHQTCIYVAEKIVGSDPENVIGCQVHIRFVKGVYSGRLIDVAKHAAINIIKLNISLVHVDYIEPLGTSCLLSYCLSREKVKDIKNFIS